MQLNDSSLKTAFLALFIVLSLSLAGVSLAGDAAPEGVPSADFPQLNTGDIYIFQKGKFRLMYKIMETAPDGSFIVEILNEEKKEKKKMRLDRNLSTKREKKGDKEYRYFLDFPLYVGKKWTDKTTLISPVYVSHQETHHKYKVTAYEEVAFGQQKVKAFKVTFRQVGGDGKGTVWYSPALNFVVKENINITQELFGFSNKNKMHLLEYRGKYLDDLTTDN